MRTFDDINPYGFQFNFSTDSVFTKTNSAMGTTPPPVSGNMEYLDDSDMEYLDGTDMLYL